MGGEPLSLGAGIAVVARKELRVMVFSPLAWVFVAAMQFLGGLIFTISLADAGEASLRGMLPDFAVTLLFCLPMVTMRTFAEEARSGTLELLLTAPVPLGSLVLGKWIAVLALCGAMLVATLPFPVVLAMYGTPDPGALLTSYLGLGLCCAVFAAAGTMVSSWTRDQMVAAVGTVLVLLPSWLAGAARPLAPAALEPLLAELAFVEHLRSFGRGVIDTGDLAWFAGLCFACLFVTWRGLESRRWR